MDKDTIIHVLNGDLPFHTLGKSENIIKFSTYPHFLLIYLTKEDQRTRYIDLFAKYHFTSYYITKPAIHHLPFLCKLLLMFKRDPLTPPLNDLVFFLLRFRTNRILFHGYFFTQFIVCLIVLKQFKNVNWICWGPMLRKAVSDNCNIRDMINNWFIKAAYKQFNSVICLLKCDKDELESNFSLKNVFLGPYGIDYTAFCQEYSDIISSMKPNRRPRILVGNSAHLVDDYIAFIEGIETFPSDVEFTFMMNYGMNSHMEKVIYLKQILKEKKINYFFWDKTESHKIYIQKISQFDVYVCPAQYQSGLGAIYNMLFLGKAVYAAGYNLQWVLQCGFTSVNVIGKFLPDIMHHRKFIPDPAIVTENRNLLISLMDPARSVRRHEEIVFRST